MKAKTTAKTSPKNNKTAPKKAPITKKSGNKTAVKQTKTAPVKSASTRATAKNQAPKETTPAKKKDNYMLIKSGLDREGKQQYTAVKVHDKTPRGWKEDKGATTAPVGYKWITNGKSALFGKRKTALVKD